MKVTYKMAKEIKAMASYIDIQTDYRLSLAYNSNGKTFYFYKFNGKDRKSKIIKTICHWLDCLKKHYNWSNKRTLNFFELIYRQWIILETDENGEYYVSKDLTEFQTWDELFIYIQHELQLQYWPTKELMEQKI